MLFAGSRAGAARLAVTASRSELLYSSSTTNPSCSKLFKTDGSALPFNIVRLHAETPPGVPPDQVRYQWSVRKGLVGLLAADADLGADEQEPAIRALCADLGNGCVLTEEQLAVYNKASILWVAPGCDALPDNTTRPFHGGRVRFTVRASIGKRSLGKGSATVGYGRLGSLTLFVTDPGERRFRDGIGVPGGEKIFLNPVFAVRLDSAGGQLPSLDEVTVDSGGAGSVTLSVAELRRLGEPACSLDPTFTACTDPGQLLYTSGGKHLASATAVLEDGSALCDKLAVNVRVTTIVPKLEVSLVPKRSIYIPGNPVSGSVNLRVRLRNASPQRGGNILLTGNVLTCESEVRIGPSTLSQKTQIDLQHCSSTVHQACASDADCTSPLCQECKGGEVCLTSSYCSTPTSTPIGCTRDADCQPPRCRACSPADACIRVLPLKQIFLGVGDAVDLVESTIGVANTLPGPARVKDTWTVHTFNAGDDSAAVKYTIAPRPGVKP